LYFLLLNPKNMELKDLVEEAKKKMIENLSFLLEAQKDVLE